MMKKVMSKKNLSLAMFAFPVDKSCETEWTSLWNSIHYAYQKMVNYSISQNSNEALIYCLTVQIITISIELIPQCGKADNRIAVDDN